MKKKIRILIYPLLFMGVLLILPISCKNDDPIIKKDVTITWVKPADITVGTLLSAAQLNATADVPGSFVYTPSIGASLAFGANQDLKVDFTPTDAETYNTATKTVKINVNTKKNPIITWSNPADITFGTLLSVTQLNATADVPGTFVYTPAIDTKLNAGTNQDLKVNFTPTDLANYNVVSKSVKINVREIEKKNPVITWANPFDIIVGTLLSATQLNATADIAGTFVYTPSIGASLSEGSYHDLKVDFTPTDLANYNVVSKSVKINVIALIVPNIIFNPSKTYGTVSDQDGNSYKTITIGTQVWMAENLKTTKYADGTAIPLVTGYSKWDALTSTSKAYCWYNDNIANKANYGALYTWAAAMNGAASDTANPSGVQGVCPTGWHLPSDAEWTQLTTYLGGASVAGGKLKETSTTHWNSPNKGATNETGFSALPGGSRNDNGTFYDIGGEGYWWSASESDARTAWRRYMFHNYSSLSNYNFVKKLGLSVRCVRD